MLLAGTVFKKKKTTQIRLCIGNQMISSVIWNKSAPVNFSKITKIAQARSAIVVFEKFTSAYLFQIAGEKFGFINWVDNVNWPP